ncbi:hypothetical protein [uncultured Nostoc sp.]
MERSQNIGMLVSQTIAIALWQTWEPHRIFMDIGMPLMDGYEGY